MGKTKDQPMTRGEVQKRCDVSKIRVGSVYSRESHGKVTRITFDGIEIQNAEGAVWTVGKEIVEKEFYLADQAGDLTVTQPRTDLIATLVSFARVAMTVTFRKKVDPADAAETLLKAATDGPLLSEFTANIKAFKKAVKDVLEGEERTMVGHHEASFDAHGRLKFHEQGVGLRLVDPRTIESLIVANVRYEVR